jgi:large subunit ribosomal protein L9
MSMEVILKEHVEHLGQRGDVVKVANGYARNYLLPRKLALAVTAENKRQIERERAKAEAKEAEELKDAQALLARVEATGIVITRRVGENNALYGSVTTADIAEALAARQLTVDRRKIQLAEPLKTLGEHVVPVKLYRDVIANLKVTVAAAGSAAGPAGPQEPDARDTPGANRRRGASPPVVRRRPFPSCCGGASVVSCVPPCPIALCPITSKPRSACSARSSSAIRRSTRRPRSSTPAISSGTRIGAFSRRWWRSPIATSPSTW